MKRIRLPLSIVAAFAAVAQLNAQTTVVTDPVGFVTVTITPGTGSGKKNTFFSVPLLGTEGTPAQGAAGTISGVSTTTISNSSADWIAGGLSAPAAPFLIQITSGAAQGRMFQVSTTVSNTATTLTISPSDQAQVNLTTLGIVAGDGFKIHPCYTLVSFFGTPAETGIRGGTNANSADTIATIVNGATTTFFYNTGLTPNRWSRVGPGTSDWGNTPVVPYYGVQYARLPTNVLSFITTGAVPVIQRAVAVKNSQSTLLSQYWPANSTLGSLGLQNLPGWQKNATSANSDTVVLFSGGASTTYWNNGTNWRRVGPGTNNFDSTVIPIGTAIQIRKQGSSSGYSTLTQAVPYTP